MIGIVIAVLPLLFPFYWAHDISLESGVETV